MYFRQKQMRSLVRLILEAVRQTGVTAEIYSNSYGLALSLFGGVAKNPQEKHKVGDLSPRKTLI